MLVPDPLSWAANDHLHRFPTAHHAVVVVSVSVRVVVAFCSEVRAPLVVIGVAVTRLAVVPCRVVLWKVLVVAALVNWEAVPLVVDRGIAGCHQRDCSVDVCRPCNLSA